MRWVLKFKHWWRGELRHRSIEEILSSSEPIRPRLVRFLYSIGGFWLREWRWLIATLLVIIGLILAYLRLGK